MRVGIPRGLFYYHYYPLCRAFFDALGVTCVASPPTHRQILSEGILRVTGETCLPVKVYLGHVLALIGQVDHLFVPLIRTLAPEEENCPRLLGLPDVVRAVAPEAPPILSPEIDLQRGTRQVASVIYNLGRRFVLNPLRVKKAADHALGVQHAYESMLHQGVSLPVALARFERVEVQSIELDEFSNEASYRLTSTAIQAEEPGRRSPPRVALVGHAYNLHDEYVNHRLVSRLRSLGVDLVTSDAVSSQLGKQSIEELQWKQYWSYEYELVGAAAYYLARERLDGMIAVMAFGCGPDAVMLGSLQELSRRYGVALMNLVLDEHTGEAGLVTRIEAFVDMLERRAIRQPL